MLTSFKRAGGDEPGESSSPLLAPLPGSLGVAGAGGEIGARLSRCGGAVGGRAVSGERAGGAEDAAQPGIPIVRSQRSISSEPPLPFMPAESSGDADADGDGGGDDGDGDEDDAGAAAGSGASDADVDVGVSTTAAGAETEAAAGASQGASAAAGASDGVMPRGGCAGASRATTEPIQLRMDTDGQHSR